MWSPPSVDEKQSRFPFPWDRLGTGGGANEEVMSEICIPTARRSGVSVADFASVCGADLGGSRRRVRGRSESNNEEKIRIGHSFDRGMTRGEEDEDDREERQDEEEDDVATLVADELGGCHKEDDDRNGGWDGFRATEEAICDTFISEETGKVSVNDFLDAITVTGVRTTDPRLNESMQGLKSLLKRFGTSFEATDTLQLTEDQFKDVIRLNVMFINRVLRTNFVVSDWLGLCRQIYELYTECKSNWHGRVSDFIPQLADYSPDMWGVAVCSIDGQRFSAGDANVPFCLQACCRVLNYAIALNDHGAKRVHSFVGQEPSGRNVKDLVLNEENKPHNPMNNAGAISVTSLLKDKHPHMATRFDAIYSQYSKMAGKEHVGFSNTSYLSERHISYRNIALGYLLRENNCLPKGERLNETVELLLQLYSVEVTCESLAVIAATLANGGVCPITGEYVIGSNCVRDVLSLMYSCGMNDYSGKFAFYVGLPARSSISGAIMLIVPNVMGIAVWSPPLDQYDNSVRGVQFCREFVKKFHLHNYDVESVGERKLDPKRVDDIAGGNTLRVASTLFAAGKGDLVTLRRYFLERVDLTQSDYDGRTPLHIAAAEGKLECVKFLLQVVEVASNARDRYGNTPADDAHNQGHDDVADFIEKWTREKSD